MKKLNISKARRAASEDQKTQLDQISSNRKSLDAPEMEKNNRNVKFYKIKYELNVKNYIKTMKRTLKRLL